MPDIVGGNYDHPLDVMTFLIKEQALGASVALVAVTHTVGGSVRSTGALVGVSSREVIAGHISNGCVDGALMFQAITAMRDNKVSQIRFGAGSPYKDLQLPCGGSIDLLIIPHPDVDILTSAHDQLIERQAVNLMLGLDGHLAFSGPSGVSGWGTDKHGREHYSVYLQPKLLIRLAGVGAEMLALAQLAVASGFDVYVQSPNKQALEQIRRLGAVGTGHLTDPVSIPKYCDDQWTAFVLLFHDHDWEPALLAQALKGPAFYIGALGSRKTHADRCKRLQETGDMSATELGRIHGPIGLVPSLRDASMVALSCLAEIIQEFVHTTAGGRA